jgi:DNA mismatch repair protein MutS2
MAAEPAATISEKALRTLEFPKVLERLANHTSFSLGRERAQALQPATDVETVRALLAQTDEGLRVLDEGVEMSLGGARDIRAAVRRAERGGVLDPEQLLDIQSTLECGDRVRNAIGRLDESYPWLHEQHQRMGAFRGIVEAIGTSIDERGEVMDSASPALGRIRTELRTAQNRIVERLNALVGSSFRTLVQESLVTVRNGRYVIPVRADAKGQVRGIVHDQSASGATVYIEPAQITDLNNRWRQLQLDEADEVERILLELSGRVGDEAPRILSTVDALGAIDVVLAKARYGAALRATRPEINGPQNQQLSLLEARHPLLTGHVVPISISLGHTFKVLVITGPNTGGKTVALKTVGLLTLMAQCGLLIPALEGSQVAVFSGIFADIGDEQSIEQSLSTFSSHMSTIIGILRDMPPDSLVLLDELGAGTDPTEGAALARAIITYLLQQDVRAICTTHYSELKAFAYSEPGVENASVEFDVETLSPTYRLSIGLPGRSNALAIASRLGLPPQIIDLARSFLTSSEKHVETLLADIARERDEVGELYARAGEANREAQRLRQRLQDEVESILAQRESILAEARAEAEASVEGLRQQLDRLEIELRTSLAAPQVSLASLKQRLDETVKTEPALLAPRRPKPPRLPPPSTHAIGVGDRVEVTRLGQTGIVTAIHQGRDEVEVQVGVLKTRVKHGELRFLGEGEKEAERETHNRTAATTVSAHRSIAASPGLELDMRGWRADEVAPQLERYVNDAYMAGMPFVRIIHGKGTGALRQVVREELSTNPLVSSFASAEPREGGDGVTIARLSTT